MKSMSDDKRRLPFRDLLTDVQRQVLADLEAQMAVNATKKLMTEERYNELRPYFTPEIVPCGCVWLGSERVEICEAHEKVNPYAARSELLERMTPSGDTWPARIGVGALSAIYKGLDWVHGCLADEVEAQKTAKHHLRNALREIADAVSWLTR